MADLRLSPGVLFVRRYRIPVGRADAWRAPTREMTELVQPSGVSNVLPKGVPICFVPSGLVDTLPPVSA